MIATRRERTATWLLGLGGLAAVLAGVEIEDRVGGSFRLRPATARRGPRPGGRLPPGGPLRRGRPGLARGAGGPAGGARPGEPPGAEAGRGGEARARLAAAGDRAPARGGRRAAAAGGTGRAVAGPGATGPEMRSHGAFERTWTSSRADRRPQGRAGCGPGRLSPVQAARRPRGRRPRRRSARTRGSTGSARPSLAEAQAARRALQAKGTLEAEAEVARRERGAGRSPGGLRLLEAGTRPEEIEAQRPGWPGSRRSCKHLEEQRRKQDVFSPISGLITTPRLREKMGQYLREGDLICVVEARAALEAEIALAEQDVARVRPGQQVRLEGPRPALRDIHDRVDRVAPVGRARRRPEQRHRPLPARPCPRRPADGDDRLCPHRHRPAADRRDPASIGCCDSCEPSSGGRRKTMPWQPLLEGRLREHAWESVRAILADLESRGRQPSGDPSLAGGTTGLTMLHGYLAQSGRSPGSAALARRHLEHASAFVANNPIPASLYSGLTGVGWAVAHLQGRLPGLDGEDDLAEIDAALLDHLDQSPWRGAYDLIEGLVGFGVYALERLPRPAAAACLEPRGRSARRDGRAPGRRHHVVDRSDVAPRRDPHRVPPRLLQPGVGPRGAGRDRPARAGLRCGSGPGQGAALA